MKNRTIPLFVTLLIFLATPTAWTAEVTVSGPEGQAVASTRSVELKYPPIHLELAEAVLTPEEKNTKRELVDNSQVLEGKLHSYGMVYEDPRLLEKLQSLLSIEDLGPKAKGFKFRIYVLRDPQLNAMTTPSGSIYINSGLLAVLEDFDQLRLALAHEAHHILDQDIVHQFNKIKREVGAIKVLQMIAAPAVAVAIGQSDSDSGKVIANIYTAGSLAVNISYTLSVAGYGRENEDECDRFALNIFKTRRYSFDSAHGLFMTMENESEKYEHGLHSHLFATHDSGQKRAERVAELMKEIGYQPGSAGPKADDGYDELTRQIRLENARINVKLGRVQHALDDLKRLDTRFPKNAEILSLLGDAYAMLAANPKYLKEELSRKEWKKLNIEDPVKHAPVWATQALSYYDQAIAADAMFADPHRGKAALAESREEWAVASAHYRRYLELKPAAADLRFVKAKIERLEKKLLSPVSVSKK